MTHKFLPPVLVNYSLPFRIEESSRDHNKATVMKLDNMFKVSWDNGMECTFDRARVDGCFEKGIWRMIEEPLGETFNFLVGGDDTIYTYTKLNDTQAKVSWPSEVVGGVSSHDYHITDVIGCIQEGLWIVLPSDPTNTAEQAFEDAFSAVQGMATPIVKNAKELNMENGSKVVFATGGERRWNSVELKVSKVGDLMEATVNIPANASKGCVEAMHSIIADFNMVPSTPLLESIKSFTQSGKFSIGIHKGVYTVYGRDDEYKATSDKQLVEVMKALETLEGVS